MDKDGCKQTQHNVTKNIIINSFKELQVTNILM